MQKGHWLSQEHPNRYSVQSGGNSPVNDSPEELSSTGEEETRDRLQTPAVRTRTSRKAAKIEVQFPTQNMRP